VSRGLDTPYKLAVRCTDYGIRELHEREIMAAKTVNVALIGTKFMGKAHSNDRLPVVAFAKYAERAQASGHECLEWALLKDVPTGHRE
jgi:hypothetical protein